RPCGLILYGRHGKTRRVGEECVSACLGCAVEINVSMTEKGHARLAAHSGKDTWLLFAPEPPRDVSKTEQRHAEGGRSRGVRGSEIVPIGHDADEDERRTG